MSNNEAKIDDTTTSVPAVGCETPCYAFPGELRKAAKCVFLAVEESVAQSLASKLNRAADIIDEFQEEMPK